MKIKKIESCSIQEAVKNGSSFWSDGKNVFYQRNNIPLKNANPKNIWYYKDFAFDDKRIFYENQLLKGVSPEDFVVLNYAFVKTKSHILTQNKKIKYEPTDCIKVLDDGIWYGQTDNFPRGYILINDTIWYSDYDIEAVKLSRVNAKEFISLQDGVLGIDNERVYAFGKIVKGASARDFKKLTNSIRLGYYTSNEYLFYENKKMMPLSSISVEDISIVDEDKHLIYINKKFYASGIEV